MTQHTEWLELAEIYAMGALEDPDLSNLKDHLSGGCTLCQKTIARAENLLSSHAMFQTRPTQPPAELKLSLMERITPPTPVAIAVPALGLGLVVSAVVILFWLVPSQIMAPAAAPQLATTSANQPHDAMLLSLLSAPETTVIEFNDPKTGKLSTAKLHFNPKACAGCFTVQGLSRPEAGKIYELWAIRGDKPVPVGVFSIDDGGHAHLDFKTLSQKQRYDQFAVTLEPAGGSILPTGPMMLLSR